MIAFAVVMAGAAVLALIGALAVRAENKTKADSSFRREARPVSSH